MIGTQMITGSETFRRRFSRSKKGWRCSLDRISKVYLCRQQKSKLEIKFHLYLSDSHHHQKKKKKKKDCHMGVKTVKVLRFFFHILWSHGVLPSNTRWTSSRVTKINTNVDGAMLNAIQKASTMMVHLVIEKRIKFCCCDLCWLDRQQGNGYSFYNS